MNKRLFHLALGLLLLLAACSTQKESPAPTRPRVTHINRMGERPYTKLTPTTGTLPVTQPKATDKEDKPRDLLDSIMKAIPDTVTLKKPIEKKEHIYKGYHEAKIRTGLDNHTRMLKIMTEHTNSSTDSIVYPDYYGGTYYDGIQRLVILTTEKDSASSQVKELKERLGNRRIVYRTCKNSYNSLIEVHDSIIAQSNRKTPLALNIVLFYISEKNNKIGIHLLDASDERKQEVFDLFGKDRVMITGSGPITVIDH